ncbi:hypothetical protein C5S31_05575 [ANME-1 cluster archaeon GoMg2]|nr:hypothetical protein [ANME-1 cluster archaeon GoMg2]
MNELAIELPEGVVKSLEITGINREKLKEHWLSNFSKRGDFL